MGLKKKYFFLHCNFIHWANSIISQLRLFNFMKLKKEFVEAITIPVNVMIITFHVLINT